MAGTERMVSRPAHRTARSPCSLLLKAPQHLAVVCRWPQDSHRVEHLLLLRKHDRRVSSSHLHIRAHEQAKLAE
jgi:hypothetical protein